MPKFFMPRAFRAFEPSRHVHRVAPTDAPPVGLFVGADIGIGAPCVAVHGLLHEDRHLHVFRHESQAGVGLDLFTAGGSLGEPDEVTLVAAERAVDARSPLNGQRARDVIEAYGLRVMACRTPPLWRLDSINARLDQPGPPGSISIDPSCVGLIGSLIGHRAVRTENRTIATDTPGSTHDVDALGYLVEAAARWAAAETLLGVGVLVDVDC